MGFRVGDLELGFLVGAKEPSIAVGDLDVGVEVGAAVGESVGGREHPQGLLVYPSSRTQLLQVL